MFIQQTQKVIDTFYERYAKSFDMQRGDYTEIHSFLNVLGEIRVWFSKGRERVIAWLDENDELHLQTPSGENLFDYADELNLKEEDIRNIRYGKTKSLSVQEKNDILSDILANAVERLRECSGSEDTDRILEYIGTSRKEMRRLGFRFVSCATENEKNSHEKTE